ncbi:cellulose biosynthesis cyclic di-GMP-binding regulatory protein BcsB [Sporosarcina cascadiensis]|uniref:cellulose biosynthesis cyclic di-GMP-binding regulatory protein BcsB n=1 Tax=Sporosarcina cascadiensis TaxID=2660747 RepID=UPI00129AD748|nr:cellulose biosynthesis cyclic di-GMP-binding regulatory protein BcsB [Sporosarcina cascadiensis]
MNRLFIGILTVLLCASWQTASEASETKEPLHLTQVQLDADQSASKKQPITNQPIELKGPEQEITFYYELQENQSASDQAFVLNFSHSELLIAPSAVTVRVDGEALKSVALPGEKETDKMVVPLKGKALKKGYHEVTVSFYGVIKEGVCVEQGTTGNWMTIQIDSYIKLDREATEKNSLENYPAAFTGTEKNPVTIILAENAAMASLDSALKVGAFLSKQSQEEHSVRVVRESDVKKIKGSVLFIGSVDEFTSPFMKDVLKQADLPVEQDTAVISFEKITDGKQEVDALFVIAKSPEDLEKRIATLTDLRLTEQLAGELLVLNSIPEKPEKQDHSTFLLKDFGMSNLILDSQQRESQQFFHYLPYSVSKEQTPVLELHLKHTDFAFINDEETTSDELLENDVELVVWVNDVPHSINIRQLQEEKDGIYTVQVPIDKKAVKDHRMVSLQFTASGLLSKNPCITTDRNRWIYIEEDSFFTFPKEKKSKAFSFAEFPFPFVDQEEETLIVLPAVESVDDNQLLELYETLFVTSQSMNWKIEQANEISEDSLKNHQLLFIGGPNVQPALQEQSSKLAVAHENGKPDLAAAGFLRETTDAVSWIQPSLWGNKEYTMMVLESVEGDSTVDSELLSFLSHTDEAATMAVKSGNGKLYTNASALQSESHISDVKSETQENRMPVVWLIGFGGLIVIAIACIYLVIRKRRRFDA